MNELSPASITIISGEIESGKTSYCLAVVAGMEARGWDVRGIASPAVFEGETKTAIDAMDLSTTEQRRLADLRTSDISTSGPATKRWAFYPETIDWCNDLLKRSTPCDLLVVDELGPLEFERGSGLLEGLQAIETRAYRQAIVVVRFHLIEQARSRWPDAEVKPIDQLVPPTYPYFQP